MANENKKEKAGETTPATPSIVEGTQELEFKESQNDPKTTTGSIQVELDVDITDLKAEHQKFKDKIQIEIDKIQSENEALKAENAKLKNSLEKLSAKSKAKKGDPKYIVISAFRGTKEGEDIFDIDTDVSHFDTERLQNLIDRELVKKV